MEFGYKDNNSLPHIVNNNLYLTQINILNRNLLSCPYMFRWAQFNESYSQYLPLLLSHFLILYHVILIMPIFFSPEL